MKSAASASRWKRRRGRTPAAAASTRWQRGTPQPGRLADSVVIDRDLRRVPPETIRDARVLMTVVDGPPVYERR